MTVARAEAARAVPISVRGSWILGWFVAGRMVVFAAAFAAHLTGPGGYVRADLGHAFGLLGAWDGRWYRMVASDGYLLVPGRQSDPAFFPLYPVLLRAVHYTGVGYATSGLIVSNLALVVGLYAFHALSRDLLGASLAKRATIYLALFPLGYVFSMSYPESFVLAAIALAALAARRRYWLTAALFGALAALARPEGVFVALPIAASAWSFRRALGAAERGRAIGAILAPLAALIAFPVYLASVLNDPLAWSRAEQAWGRQFSPIGFVHALVHLPQTLGTNPGLARDVVALPIYLGLIAAARRAGVPRPWLIAAVGIVVLPVFSGAFDSVGRFGLLALPIFWGLAWIGRAPRHDVLLRTSFLLLLAVATITVPFVFP